MSASPYEYDVCLSFASEQREYVEDVASELNERKIKFFYDKYKQATLWGKDLYEHLDLIYRHQARFCILFISTDYAHKVWTSHERKSAQARAFEQSEEYILPVRFDDTEIPGIRPTVGYIDAHQTSPAQLASLVSQKLTSLSSPQESNHDHDATYQQVPMTTKETDTAGWTLPDMPAAARSKWQNGIRRPQIWAPLTGFCLLAAAAAVWYTLPHGSTSFPIPHEIACKPPSPQELDENIKLEVNNLIEATYQPCLDHRDQNFHIEGESTVSSLTPNGKRIVEYTVEGDKTGYIKSTIDGPHVDTGKWSASWQQNSSPDCWSQLIVTDPQGHRFVKTDTDCHPHR